MKRRMALSFENIVPSCELGELIDRYRWILSMREKFQINPATYGRSEDEDPGEKAALGGK